MSHDLRVGFGERHHKCLYEAIDIAYPSAKMACPEGVREESRRDIPSMLVPPSDVTGSNSVPAVEEEIDPTSRGASGSAAPIEGVFDSRDTSVSAFPPNWDEMMEMLKPIPCFIDAEPPSTKMSETVEMLVAGIRDMVRQHELLSERLKVVESMRAFISHRLDGGEKLRLRLERSETDLAAIRKAVVEGVEALKKAEGKREAFRIEAKKLRKNGEITEAKLKEVEQEISQSKNEIEELRTRLSSEKKEKEELKVRLAAQKKELEVGFIAQKKELEAEY